MKFICLGFLDETAWDAFSAEERDQLIEQCFAYDDELRRGGHFLGGEALQHSREGATVRMQNGKVSVTDGPFAEIKEHLGGILFLEARDLNHAIQLMSLHPGVRMGGFEIRPADVAFCELAAARKSRLEGQLTP
ncbi:YciI family protein [Planctomicrobium sp. SH661]|uniref:YciI family protein n=1 Tax=Planctomicrobium sp. SH661 TaxID=3448124 RepID=UPI003F5C6088